MKGARQGGLVRVSRYKNMLNSIVSSVNRAGPGGPRGSSGRRRMVSMWVTALILSGMMAGAVADVVAVPPDLSHDEKVLNGQSRQGVSGRTRTDGRLLDNDRKSDAGARPDKTGEYQEGSGGAEEAVPQTMTSTDCVQRMVQWISRVNEGCLLYTSPSPRDA